MQHDGRWRSAQQPSACHSSGRTNSLVIQSSCSKPTRSGRSRRRQAGCLRPRRRSSDLAAAAPTGNGGSREPRGIHGGAEDTRPAATRVVEAHNRRPAAGDRQAEHTDSLSSADNLASGGLDGAPDTGGDRAGDCHIGGDRRGGDPCSRGHNRGRTPDRDDVAADPPERALQGSMPERPPPSPESICA